MADEASKSMTRDEKRAYIAPSREAWQKMDYRWRRFDKLGDEELTADLRTFKAKRDQAFLEFQQAYAYVERVNIGEVAKLTEAELVKKVKRL